TERTLRLFKNLIPPLIPDWPLEYIKMVHNVSEEQLQLIPEEEIEKSKSRVIKACEEVYDLRLADATNLKLPTRYADVKVADIVERNIKIEDVNEVDGANAIKMLDSTYVYEVIKQESIRLLMLAGVSGEKAERIVRCVAGERSKDDVC
ncbi:MAG: hypothetical protein N3F67_06310, partial [Acidilobaceae archaeon]|nr:hypothetical protein [Acidilobaceae archaeon]